VSAARDPKADVLARLRGAEARIRAFGVRRLALFGSFARGTPRANSDVDLLVEFIPDAKTFDAFMGLAFFLEDLLQRRVELLTRESLSPYIGPRILLEAEDVIRAA
jgi:predicted nucleotidyltransferase